LLSSCKIKASSLLESIIALVIIAGCILISLRVFTSILDSNRMDFEVEVSAELKGILNKTKTEQDFSTEIFQFENYSISKIVSDYDQLDRVKHVQLLVQSKTDTIYYNYLINRYDVEN